MTQYTITSTDSTISLPIQAGTTNGPSVGAANINTDLILYGQGSFNWGQGLEQNLLRIMESFASPALNPNDPDDQQVPDPTPVASNPTAFGIKNPIVGQNWFNKSNNRLYVCVTARSNNAEPEWQLDGEGRYLPLGGGTLSGNLDITRPMGSGDAQLRLRTNDNIHDIRIELIDTVAKAEIVVEQDADNNPNTNIDIFKIIKRNGPAINNEIALHDNYIETHSTSGKIRTPLTANGDVAATVTTKSYVDNISTSLEADIDNITNVLIPGIDVFTGGTITEDFTVDTPDAMIRAKSSDTAFPKFVLADSGGNKAKIELDQTTGGVGIDQLVFSRGIFNGPNETGTTNNEIRMSDNRTSFSADLLVENASPLIEIKSTNPLAPSLLYLSDNQSVKGEVSILPTSADGGIDDFVFIKRSGPTVFLNELRLRDEETSTIRPFVIRDNNPFFRTIDNGSEATITMGADGNNGFVLFNNPTTGISSSVFLTDHATLTAPESNTDTSESDDPLKLTTKSYVDDRIQTRSSFITQEGRTFQRSGANGTWFSGLSFAPLQSTAIQFDDLDITLPRFLNRSEYKSAINADTQATSDVFYKITFSCVYTLRYLDHANPQGLVGHTSHTTQYQINNGPWTDFHESEVPVNAINQFQSGRIYDTRRVRCAVGDTVRLRLNPDAFGPIYETSSNPVFQAVYDSFDTAFVSEIEWEWEV